MSGQLAVRNNVFVIKDGEDNIPITNNSSYMARVNKIFEFKYVWIGKIKYAELIKQI